MSDVPFEFKSLKCSKSLNKTGKVASLQGAVWLEGLNLYRLIPCKLIVKIIHVLIHLSSMPISISVLLKSKFSEKKYLENS